MTRPKGRLVAVVAAVAVASVAAGGVLAARQGPASGQAAGDDRAVPLAGAAPAAPKPSTPKPTGAPGPAKVRLTLSKLAKGRDPQVTYVSGREVRGGPGETVTIPGRQQISSAVRYQDEVLALLVKGAGSELVRISPGVESVSRVADVQSLAVRPDSAAVAYATSRVTPDNGGLIQGGTVYFEDFDGTLELARPRDWDLKVISVVDDTVYFRSAASASSPTWSLYEWRTSEKAATRINTVRSPSALSSNGSTAVSLEQQGITGTCSSLSPVATGKRLWRTCEYQLSGFTPDGKVALARPAVVEDYAVGLAAALDAADGTLLREWTGLSFLNTVAEDDDHLLIRVDDGSQSRTAIIRCAVSTGACELATALTTKELVLP